MSCNLVVSSFRFLALYVTEITSVAFEQGLIVLVWGNSGFLTSCNYTDFSILTSPAWGTVPFRISDSFSKVTRHLFQQCFPYNIAGLHIVNIVQSEAYISCNRVVWLLMLTPEESRLSVWEHHSHLLHGVALGTGSWSYHSTTSVGETSFITRCCFPSFSLRVGGFLYTEIAPFSIFHWRYFFPERSSLNHMSLPTGEDFFL